jgi:hypothetical protein
MKGPFCPWNRKKIREEFRGDFVFSHGFFFVNTTIMKGVLDF